MSEMTTDDYRTHSSREVTTARTLHGTCSFLLAIISSSGLHSRRVRWVWRRTDESYLYYTINAEYIHLIQMSGVL